MIWRLSVDAQLGTGFKVQKTILSAQEEENLRKQKYHTYLGKKRILDG